MRPSRNPRVRLPCPGRSGPTPSSEEADTSNDNAFHEALAARLEREDAIALARAKAEAHAAGKEPLDVVFVERSWPDNPNARYEAAGVRIPPERRIRDWERLYYRRFPAIRTNAEFVARMKSLDLEGYFD